nr:nickel pincer cofactor biosynthesis protein LarB [Rubripirellula obstinata]
MPSDPGQTSDPEQTKRIDNAVVDLGRQARCGFGEAIYGEGKSADLIIQIVRAQLDQGQQSLVTRITDEVAEEVSRHFDHCRANPLAKTLRIATQEIDPPIDDQSHRVHVAVVTAGSTDQGIAEEAIETLGWMGIPVRSYSDIGVAGPQRLVAAVPRLREASALVVVAGMEGALPSVVAGHISAPIIAVPTSVGYGANLGGVTALLGMLTSCAAGVAVVNIDAGFKGAYMAGLVVRQQSQDRDTQQQQSQQQ